jgi:hypothetical protein
MATIKVLARRRVGEIRPRTQTFLSQKKNNKLSHSIGIS